MSWRVARAIQQLLDELNAAVPNRSKASDGTIGDAEHVSRKSDHNPWVVDGRGEGVVTAVDLTDDDEHGADMSLIVDYLTKVRDKRIKYLIHRGKIYSSYPTRSTPAWAARPYAGPNAHERHLHVSVNPEPYAYDDARPWGIAKALKPEPPTQVAGRGVKAPPFPLPAGAYFGPKEGPAESVSGHFSHATDLRQWQAQMKRRGWRIQVTGRYDDDTARVAKAFRRQLEMDDSAAIGPHLWAAAWTAPVTRG